MNYQHKSLAQGRWETFSFLKQMANVSSEVQRALNWQNKNPEYSRAAFERVLELLDLTIKDKKNHKRGRLKELLRLREVLVDYFCFENAYNSTSASWQKYFSAFENAAVL